MASPDSTHPRTLVDRTQMAHILGVVPRTVQRWQYERGLPVIKLGKYLRYDPERVLTWLHGHEQTTASRGSDTQ